MKLSKVKSDNQSRVGITRHMLSSLAFMFTFTAQVPKNMQAAKKISRNLTNIYLFRNKWVWKALSTDTHKLHTTIFKLSFNSKLSSIFQRNVINH